MLWNTLGCTGDTQEQKNQAQRKSACLPAPPPTTPLSLSPPPPPGPSTREGRKEGRREGGKLCLSDGGWVLCTSCKSPPLIHISFPRPEPARDRERAGARKQQPLFWKPLACGTQALQEASFIAFIEMQTVGSLSLYSTQSHAYLPSGVCQ